MKNPIILLIEKIKRLFIGKTLNPEAQGIFHNVSLIAFFAWVGLGSDGLSSSVYGPAEAFHVLHQYPFLAIFVGLASVVTIIIISASYTQIIEKFPNGGGGYLVASKLISPFWGMVSGAALLIDYVLTITISIASGADAIFSFLPYSWHVYKIEIAIAAILALIILNLRGAKESVKTLIPIFFLFIFSHVFIILYSLFNHSSGVSHIAAQTSGNIHLAISQVGLWGMLILILKAYSMGAGTYTGIEAISNGVSILREPKVKTAKRTMLYMTLSLSFMVMGLMLAYIFLNVGPQEGKTLNAILLDSMTLNWSPMTAKIFTLITLISEAAILFVAAQTGFLDGPRVLSNMALDRWFPSKFAMLSDRLVTQKGVLLMGLSAIAMMIFTQGQVGFLIVLYSINVFITFVLSQLGMSRHWISKRHQLPNWKRKLLVSGTGFIFCMFILISMVILKFNHGAWITVVITGSLIIGMLLIKRHYIKTAHSLRKLDKIMTTIQEHKLIPDQVPSQKEICDPKDRTAVLLVNGYTGLGLHTLAEIHKSFPNVYSNFIFVQIGLIDAGVFKGEDEVEALKTKSTHEIQRYVDLMESYGYCAKGICKIGVDIVAEINTLAPEIRKTFPNALFFGGQLVFPEETLFTKWLHNTVVFTIQEKLYKQGIPFMILPVRVLEETQ